jgi:hypothetical protein
MTVAFPAISVAETCVATAAIARDKSNLGMFLSGKTRGRASRLL